jgi:hypothetical protein
MVEIIHGAYIRIPSWTPLLADGLVVTTPWGLYTSPSFMLIAHGTILSVNFNHYCRARCNVPREEKKKSIKATCFLELASQLF